MSEEHSGRHFTVAVFVVWEEKVLLHLHRKLAMWLPPGGHIEKNEIPDDVAVREVFEETGLRVELVGENAKTLKIPCSSTVPRECSSRTSALDTST